MNITGQTIIITGGGSGMGAATARMLGALGAKPVLWDMNLDAAKAVAVDCGGRAAQVDVTNEESIKAALADVDAPRALINCAGILIGKRIIGREGPADLAHFQKVIAVNLVGSFNTMRLVGDAMSKLEPVNKDGARGVIINAASIAAFEGQIGQAAYSASKGGIVAMTLPAARELAKFGIRVMAIAPGAVSTPMIGEVSDELQQSIAAGIPFPARMAEPEEFAKLAAHIIDNEYLNGTVIRLDGAARLAAK
ncbi:MAG: SDR family NAD(P)-dependent oxidoreductase [Alphaproteobacteria bacterium]|nr:SDR family NAD(P)-dependent oxidoreductase [Alphaproteobacteria bacterium]